MPTLRIEHAVRDYDTWKNVFDNDPLDRRKSGVRGYRVFRAVDDPNLVLIDLDFDSKENAEALLERLRTEVWKTPQAKGTLTSAPETKILEVSDSNVY